MRGDEGVISGRTYIWGRSGCDGWGGGGALLRKGRSAMWGQRQIAGRGGETGKGRGKASGKGGKEAGECVKRPDVGSLTGRMWRKN